MKSTQPSTAGKEMPTLQFAGLAGISTVELFPHHLFLRQCLSPERVGAIYLTEKSREGDFFEVAGIGSGVGEYNRAVMRDVHDRVMDQHVILPIHVGDRVLLPENSQYGGFRRVPSRRIVNGELINVDWEFVAHESEILAILELDDKGDPSGLLPVGRRVFLKMEPDQTYQKGIHTPLDATDYSSIGTVTRLGTGCKLHSKDGSVTDYKFPVTAADKVLIKYNAGIQVSLLDESYRLVRTTDILAILNGDKSG